MKKPEIFGNSGLFIAQPGENGENSHCSVGNPNPRIRDQKAVGKGFDDRQWRKFHRILSQPIGSELHSVESRPYRLRPEGESRHFDSPGHCKSMLPGFCFSRLLWFFSGLQLGGKAPISASKKPLPAISAFFLRISDLAC